jgi:hypothetical protein
MGVPHSLVWEPPNSTTLPLPVELVVDEAMLRVAPIVVESDLAPGYGTWSLVSGGWMMSSFSLAAWLVPPHKLFDLESPDVTPG